MSKLNKKFKKLITPLGISLALLIFLVSTNPNKLGIGWLIVPFILLYVSILLLVLIVIDWLHNWQPRTKKQLVSANIIALVPTLMLVLDSVNQLTLKDIFLISLLGVIAGFYSGRFSIAKTFYK